MSNVAGPRGARFAPLVALGVLLAATLTFAITIHRHYPIQHWLFWRYATYWALSLSFVFSCSCAGSFILRKVCRPCLPATELLPASLATGVVIYFMGTF